MNPGPIGHFRVSLQTCASRPQKSKTMGLAISEPDPIQSPRLGNNLSHFTWGAPKQIMRCVK